MLRVQAVVLLLGLFTAGSLVAAEETRLLEDVAVISSTGAPGFNNDDYRDFDANTPAVALNPRDDDPAAVLDEFGRRLPYLPSPILLVAWSADDNADIIVGPDPDSTDDDIFRADGEFEIYVKPIESRINNNNTFEFSRDYRISAMGPEDETNRAERARYQAFAPSVAYNPDTDQFLVVWYGDDNTAPLVDNEYEIWGRLIEGSAAGGDLNATTLPGEPFRITAVGPEAETDPVERARYGAFDPQVAYNPDTGGYMLVYRADDANVAAASGGTIADDEFEIFAQPLNGDGTANGSPLRVSTMGNDSEADPAIRANFDAGAPALAWNAMANQFMVAWSGDDNTGTTVDDENEIYVRGINTNGSMPSAQARISAMGPDGDAAYDAVDPAITVNIENGDYMVAWSGDDNTSPLVDDEFEIFARRLGTTGNPVAAAFRVSTMGNDAETDPVVRASFDAMEPTVAYHPGSNRYQVGWTGDDDTAPLIEGEIQLFAQAINGDDSFYGSRVQVSDTNLDDETPTERRENSVAAPQAIYASGMIQYFYSADAPGLLDNTTGNASGHFEIFQQRVSSISAVPFSRVTNLGSSGIPVPIVPDPIIIEITIENTGPDTMVNSEAWMHLTADFPMSVQGCTSFDPLTLICQLPDIPADSTHDLTVTLETEQLQLGDPLGTQFTMTLHSQTGMEKYIDPDSNFLIDYDIGGDLYFARTILKVEGGSGASFAILPLLALLLGLRLWRVRRED